jgi:hypothetical protein
MKTTITYATPVHLVVDRHPNLATWVEELTTTNFGPNSNHRATLRRGLPF